MVKVKPRPGRGWSLPPPRTVHPIECFVKIMQESTGRASDLGWWGGSTGYKEAAGRWGGGWVRVRVVLGALVRGEKEV